MQDQAVTGHSIWLCAQAQMHAALSTEITALTGLSQTPGFEPHVTLIGDLQGDPQETAALCRRVFEAVGPIHARVSGVAQTDAYYMSLFLDLDVPDALRQAHARIANEMGVMPSANYRPHISLAYGLGAEAVPVGQLKQLKSQYTGQHIILTQAVIVASAKGVPIDAWRRVTTIAL